MSIKTFCFPALFLVLLSGFAMAQDKSSPGNDAVFNFTVSTMGGKPRQGELILVKSFKTKKIFQGNTGSDGKLSIKIPVSDTYTILYRLIADTIKYKDVKVLPEDRGSVYTIDLKHDPPRVVTLRNVFFETGLSSLRKESYPALNELVDALTSLTTLCIEIGGHTDKVGTPESNQKLSTDRANEVRGYLIKQGINPQRVFAKGYGDAKPVATNETPEGRQKNRRTEVRIISE